MNHRVNWKVGFDNGIAINSLESRRIVGTAWLIARTHRLDQRVEFSVAIWKWISTMKSASRKDGSTIVAAIAVNKPVTRIAVHVFVEMRDRRWQWIDHRFTGGVIEKILNTVPRGIAIRGWSNVSVRAVIALFNWMPEKLARYSHGNNRVVLLNLVGANRFMVSNTVDRLY